MFPQMTLLDIAKLNGHKEKRLAHLQLAIIASGYIWQEGEEGVTKSIPEQLAVPWYRLSEELDLKPILTYADIIIINWRKKDENKPLELE
ncbi:indoleamine 2,3-dioxygenase 2 [Octopus vulgaris]|uniref:Indoleamine 2,3-dioxygenase 2 n=1 Tax=Octopus vulgaris TaxID=6645 RepID=A0AA36FHH3_OCTVU|nr:indoleamine 2,3-dioxygenase 2 [Octopus vulgaris]